ncbi:hypothetical protein K227x_29810 [Rubripirellula lacrimiformis]|uniref:Prenyltransferase n=1 Tax=Rubripirellula lacrimiformis TaxID=1930273 RepID=A0A517NBR5_9BACT|nr:hypothetical protein [Rubripirellula lacrimiformis]QDT04589.1 hypothetical protein K227x_29810 [Rubripirellula lacrimiformis]
MSEQAKAVPPRSGPIRWINALSIDAVAVGIVWQAIFACAFRGSPPSLIESTTLGLTLWLIYTADHLLDATRLDIHQPRTFRHHIHHQYRHVLVVVWMVFTVIDAAAIVVGLSESLIRWGLALAAIVLLYGASVHFRSTAAALESETASPPNRRSIHRKGRFAIGKEIKVGGIFALGVGLLAWDHQPTLPLMVSTALAAVLFAANCVVVACWDTDCDRSQNFESWTSRRPNILGWMTPTLIVLGCGSMASSFVFAIPPLVAGSIAISSLSLLAAWVWTGATAGRRAAGRSKDDQRTSPQTGQTVPHQVSPAPSPSMAWLADAMLIAPPAFVWLVFLGWSAIGWLA